MRYFFFAAMFNLGNISINTNFRFRADSFLSFKELGEIVTSHHPGAKNIVILSICELNEQDYYYLLSETQ